jgi:hypothetical protein
MRMGVSVNGCLAKEIMNMKKNLKVVISLLAFCFLVVGVTWVSKSGRVHSESQSQPGIQTKSGVERINDKAKAVKGPDRAAIRGLTEEIMSQYGWDNAPSAVTDSVKDRLVNAEEDFHKGNHKGISEVDVARAVNGFVTKFKTPDYSRTSPSEVREVRGRLLTLLPDFVGRGRLENGKSESKKRGAAIAEMSPVEAAYTTMAVVYQKMYNPDFQLTQAERRASWVDKHSKTPRTVGNADSQPSATATARQQEMEGTLRRVATTTPLQDLFSLPDKVLDVLGIERQKKEDK